MSIITADEIEATRQIVLNKNTPDPPYVLTDDQAGIWSRLFMTLEPGWLTESQYDLVIAYCRHSDTANKIAKLIDQHNTQMANYDNFDIEDVKTLDRLLKIQEREVRSMSSIATRLRITNQAIRTADVKKPSSKPAPWEVTDDLMVEESSDDDSAS